MFKANREKALIIGYAIVVVIAGALLMRYYVSPFFEQKYPAGKVMLEVPFVRQKEWYCSEASASMVLQYYGYYMSQDEIHNLGYTQFENMLPILQQYIDAKYARLSLEGLIKELEKRNPVIIRIVEGRYFHTVVVVGYEDGIIYVNDPALRPKMPVSAPILLEKWAQAHFAAIISSKR